MAIDPHQFWAENWYNHAPLTDAMVAEAEQTLGVRLPAELLELLRVQNGGYTNGFAYPMTVHTSWADDHVPLDSLKGIVTDPLCKTALNLLDTPYLTKEWGLPARQVLLSGEGAYWISLGYRDRMEPSVVWIDVDRREDVQVAPSFKAFLTGLLPASAYAA